MVNLLCIYYVYDILLEHINNINNIYNTIYVYIGENMDTWTQVELA